MHYVDFRFKAWQEIIRKKHFTQEYFEVIIIIIRRLFRRIFLFIES